MFSFVKLLVLWVFLDSAMVNKSINQSLHQLPLLFSHFFLFCPAISLSLVLVLVLFIHCTQVFHFVLVLFLHFHVPMPSILILLRLIPWAFFKVFLLTSVHFKPTLFFYCSHSSAIVTFSFIFIDLILS